MLARLPISIFGWGRLGPHVEALTLDFNTCSRRSFTYLSKSLSHSIAQCVVL